ncbi:AmmeMemoRadiSam system protein B [Thermodesulfobacteriota bacterium]
MTDNILKKILASLLFLFLCFSISVIESEEKKVSIRHPEAAGRYYTNNADRLRAEISALLKNTPETSVKGEILAAMAPHASYVYSGSIAALTFKSIKDIEFDTLVIIGHDAGGDAVAYTCPVDFFETPLGKIPVDTEMLTKLHAYDKGIKPFTQIHSRDHTIEIQLPFLQVMNKNCMIVPMMFGNPTPANCSTLAKAIKATSGNKKVFILASTDMSHYPDHESAYKMDNMTLNLIKEMDINRFFKHVRKQLADPEMPGLQTAICSSGGVGTALLYSKSMGMNHVEVLKYANSGDVPGADKGRVVGYSSVLFVKK